MDYSKRSWEEQKEDALVKDKTMRVVGKKRISYLKLSALSILAACLLPSGYTNAAVSKPSQKTSDIEIKIESTSPRLTAGTGVGIAMEITNRSGKAILFDENNIVISLPPEIAPDPDNPHWITYFPTEHPPDSQVSQASTPPSIKIPSGDVYKVFCSIPSKLQKDTSEKEACKKSWWKNFIDWFRSFYIVKTVFNEMHFVFFVPGEYTIDVTAKYWISPKRPPDEDYHTIVASRTLMVDAPQSVILFGAMLGGLISYYLFPQARRRLVTSGTSKEAPSWFMKVVKEVFGIIGAILLSAIVTILLARISETQFLIKVTIADFWGAVAIGFVANYGGAEVINKIIDRYFKKQAAQAAPTQQKEENGDRSDS